MAEIKAVFFDLDGTLLTPTRGISGSTRAAITDLRRSGILVGIATGRGPSFALPLLEELSLNFAITYNGQYILDSKNVYYANSLDKRLIQRVIRYAADNHRDLSFGKADGITGSGLLKFGNSRTAGYLAGVLPDAAANVARNTFKHVVRRFRPTIYDLRKVLKEPVYQMMMVATGDETEQLSEKFSELTVTRSNPYSVDLISQNSSKRLGIERLGRIFDYDLSEVMTFGDSENDIDMLEHSGLGIAMGNARPAVKKIADYITASNSQNGISRALSYYGLISFNERESFVSKDQAFNMVKEFHRLMDGKTQEVPKTFSSEEASHRSGFKVEEIVEFLHAVSQGDSEKFSALVLALHESIEDAKNKVLSKPQATDPLTAQTDSLIDLLYYTYGSLVLSGVDPYEIFNIVHKANLAKIFPDGRPHFDSVTGKLLKPETWKEKYAPEESIARELRRQLRVAEKRKNN